MKKRVLLFLSLLTVIFVSCDPEDEPDNSILNSFTGLTVENDTIFTGQSTKITATYDGIQVTFKWTATAGDILGSGSEVTYVAPTCTPGVNQINCTASASNNSVTHSVTITVF